MTYSEITTQMYAAGLFNEVAELEKLHTELLRLQELIKSSKPICPICMRVLEPFNFKGYYDTFSGYECNCTNFVGIKDSHGAYA
jgi:hypothetical protein